MRDNDWSFGNPSLRARQRRVFDEAQAGAERSSESLAPSTTRAIRDSRHVDDTPLGRRFRTSTPRRGPRRQTARRKAIGLRRGVRRSPSECVFDTERQSEPRHVRQRPHRQPRRNRLPHHSHRAADGNAVDRPPHAGRPRGAFHSPCRRSARDRRRRERLSRSEPPFSRWRRKSAPNVCIRVTDSCPRTPISPKPAQRLALFSLAPPPRRCGRWA